MPKNAAVAGDQVSLPPAHDLTRKKIRFEKSFRTFEMDVVKDVEKQGQIGRLCKNSPKRPTLNGNRDFSMSF